MCAGNDAARKTGRALLAAAAGRPSSQLWDLPVKYSTPAIVCPQRAMRCDSFCMHAICACTAVQNNKLKTAPRASSGLGQNIRGKGGWRGGVHAPPRLQALDSVG